MTITDRIITAAPAWQSKVLKSLSVVRSPKIEEQTETEVVCLVDSASVYPSLGQFLMRQGLAIDVQPVSTSVLRVTVRQL